jgi:hypothetical protein
MSKIFLSHSSRDNFEAVALRDWLAREGWDDVFLDLDLDRGIAAGQRWERKLHEAANRCEAVIFLVSANWLASSWCQREYTVARMLNKKLFAVVIDPGKSIADLPECKGTWQAVDVTGGQDGLLLKTRLPGSHEEKHVVYSQDGLRRLKRGLDEAGLDPRFFAWPPEGECDRAPYRGLKPMEAVDAGIFFGRDAPIVEAIDRLRGLRSAARASIVLRSTSVVAGLPRDVSSGRKSFALPAPWIASATGVTNGLAVTVTVGTGTRRQARLAGTASSVSLSTTARPTSILRPSTNSTIVPGSTVSGVGRPAEPAASTAARKRRAKASTYGGDRSTHGLHRFYFPADPPRS